MESFGAVGVPTGRAVSTAVAPRTATHEQPSEEKKREAYISAPVYLIVSHTSTTFLLAGLLILAIHANDLSFEAFRSSRALDKSVASLVFLLMLAGLGIRCGLTPAHFWVSLVHPSSPTVTHALSLGIASHAL